MIKKVLQKNSEEIKILKTNCSTVKDFAAVQKTIRNLWDTVNYLKTIYPFKRGIGLAAPQIGQSVKLTVVEYNNKRYILINPQIIEHSKTKIPIREGCISFFEYRGNVPRYKYVKVKAYDQNGKEYFVEGNTPDFAGLLQHELDHLDGILYIELLPHGEKDLYLKD